MNEEILANSYHSDITLIKLVSIKLQLLVTKQSRHLKEQTPILLHL
jgi:hypothetical protein